VSDLAEHYDVVCIGGAMMGSTTAYFLTENIDFDGTVLVVEPDWTYERAATTRAHNSIREQFSNELNIRLSRFGIDFIERFHENVQVDGESPNLNFCGTGYLFLADSDELYADLEQEACIQTAAGAEVEMLRRHEVAERFPYMDAERLVGARLGGMREGSFDGWALFQGFRRRAIHNGAHYVHDRVVGLDVVAGRVDRVRLESGRAVACGHAVNASGCRARQVAAMAGVDLPIEPRARTSFVFDCRTPIEQIVPLTVMPGGVHFHREQNHFTCGTVPENDTAVDYDDLEIRHDEFEQLIWPVLAAYVPQFDRIRVVASWGGQYDYNTLDHNLIVGASSAVENLIFANGFSGHGLQQGPAVGRGISELITYGEYRSIDLSPFGYARIERNEPIVENAVI
jgi:glycine/D-amino acid oxidase-like deaminating enzyme